MKKLLIFGICWIFLVCANLSIGQELMLKEKKSTPEVSTSTETTTDTVVLPPLTLKSKEVKTQQKQSITTTSTSTSYSQNNESSDKYNFPISQFELYLAYVRYSEYQMKGSGVNLQFTVRQKPDSRKRSAWGLGGLFGKYNTKVPQTDSTTFTAKTTEYGGFLSYARTTNRPYWNSIVWNTGVKQVTDQGTIEKFSRKQIDIIVFSSLYLDLTRRRDIYFSRTNLSLYYQYPAKTEVETYNNRERIDDFIWNHKMFALNIDQTVLQFNLSEVADRSSFNVGVNAGYKHFSQDIKDIYVGGVFTELFYRLCKVARIGVEFHIDPNNNPGKNNQVFTGKKTEIKAEFDLYQIGRMLL